ncbi:MAG: hypothetical protein HN742_15030 [Lentisphaerae bacterium]|jgi:hypothetical protein|nr:hypothetical protein [Lentisphaerota bacterium]MBT7057772.1 hypothetical protein [Lentisphaerota bacterium]MBT7843191.1 hypothetical protein [Lentisphaerota bacterium]
MIKDSHNIPPERPLGQAPTLDDSERELLTDRETQLILVGVTRQVSAVSPTSQTGGGLFYTDPADRAEMQRIRGVFDGLLNSENEALALSVSVLLADALFYTLSRMFRLGFLRVKGGALNG